MISRESLSEHPCPQLLLGGEARVRVSSRSYSVLLHSLTPSSASGSSVTLLSALQTLFARTDCLVLPTITYGAIDRRCLCDISSFDQRPSHQIPSPNRNRDRNRHFHLSPAPLIHARIVSQINLPNRRHTASRVAVTSEHVPDCPAPDHLKGHLRHRARHRATPCCLDQLCIDQRAVRVEHRSAAISLCLHTLSRGDNHT